MSALADNHAERAWNALVASNTDIRRLYLTMLAERRAVLVAQAFSAASTLEKLEHARGGAAVLDALRDAHKKEITDASRRSEYANRTGRDA